MRAKVMMIATCCVSVSACVTSPAPPSPKEIGESYDAMMAPYTSRPTVTAQQFATAGLHEVDVRCDAFFTKVAEFDRSAAGTQSGLNLFGGTVTGSMAATQETAEDIAITALAFAGLDAQLANYREYELLGPFAGSARQLVTQARATYRTQDIPTDKLDAVNYVHQYAQLCTVDTIIGYINAAVSQANPTLVGDSSDMFSRADRDVVTSALGALAPGADVGSLSDEEWARLYVYLVDLPSTPDLAVAFEAEMPALRAILLTSDAPPQLTAAGIAVRNQLGALRARSSALVAATQKLREDRVTQQAENDRAVQAVAVAGLAGEPEGAQKSLRLIEARSLSAPDVGLPPSSPPRTGVIVIR